MILNQLQPYHDILKSLKLGEEIYPKCKRKQGWYRKEPDGHMLKFHYCRLWIGFKKQWV